MKSFYTWIVVISLALASGAPVAAQSPQAPTLVRVEGELKTPTGEARTGTATMVVSLYERKEDTTPLWIEQHLVTLDGAGKYTIFAGATRDEGLPKEFFLSGSAHWLGVGEQGEAEQFRIMLVSVPYALKAREADMLAGKAAADFVLSANLRDDVKSALKAESAGATTSSIVSTINAVPKFADSSGGLIDSGIVEIGGNVGIGTTNPAAALEIGSGKHLLLTSTDFTMTNGQANLTRNSGGVVLTVNQQGGGDILNLNDNGSPVVVVRDGGNVGIGTANPAAALEIGGAKRLLLTNSDFTMTNGEANITRNSGGVALTVNQQGGGDILNLNDNGSAAFVVKDGGNVGIGTTTPTAKLEVAGGDAKFGGNVTVNGNIGAKYQDVAEWVESVEPLGPGTVVIIDSKGNNRVTAALRAYDSRVAGAVSAQPGVMLGEPGSGKILVAQSGRVRIKADARYGAIRAGDLLVSSPKKGYAMRSRPVRVGETLMHRPGTVLGKALESLATGTGEILVLLTLQ